MKRIRFFELTCVSIAAVLAGACSPMAERPGLASHTTHAAGFELTVFANRAAPKVGPLRIYLEHDGTPWLAAGLAASPPIVANPIAARAAALDDKPAVVVSRPCYGDWTAKPKCSPDLWTHARYGEAVLESLGIAIEIERQRARAPSVVLVGFSGGGTLAVLLAERLCCVAGVVTVGANLDIDAWTRHHGHSALSASLNPALRAPLRRTIPQVHIFGDRDDVAPERLAARFLERHPWVEVWRVGGDHACCWDGIAQSAVDKIVGTAQH